MSDVHAGNLGVRKNGVVFLLDGRVAGAMVLVDPRCLDDIARDLGDAGVQRDRQQRHRAPHDDERDDRESLHHPAELLVPASRNALSDLIEVVSAIQGLRRGNEA